MHKRFQLWLRKFDLRSPLFWTGLAAGVVLGSGGAWAATVVWRQPPAKTAQVAPVSPSHTPSPPASASMSPTPTVSVKATPAPVAFKVTNVAFKSTIEPKWNDDQGESVCKEGATVKYTTRATITTSAGGTVKYFWKRANHRTGARDQTDERSLVAPRAGTYDVSYEWTYTFVKYDVGLSLWDREYVNLFTTSPNAMYANMDQTGEFVWGTYFDTECGNL